MTVDAQYWDERFSSREMLFSGNPNGVLVTEITDLPPGRALDVGCGEGGDAQWLAGRGWTVTAVDISRVALERAAALDKSGRVTWVQGDLSADPPPDGPFDLVTVHYIPFPHQPDHAVVHRLLDVVAPGGTFLFVGHDLADLGHLAAEGIDPTAFYQPGEIAKLLDEDEGNGWTVVVDETRPRNEAAPPGTHHTHDVVLRATRG